MFFFFYFGIKGKQGCKKKMKWGKRGGSKGEDNTKNTIHKYNTRNKGNNTISTESLASSNQSSNNQVNRRKMVFKFQWASGIPDGFVKTQIAGLCPEFSYIVDWD